MTSQQPERQSRHRDVRSDDRIIIIVLPLPYFHYCIIIKMGPGYMWHKFSPDQKWSLSKLITRVRPNSKNIFENIVLQKYSMINFGLQEYFSLFVGKLWKLKMSSWSRFKVKQETSLPLSHEYVIARTFARFEREKSGILLSIQNLEFPSAGNFKFPDYSGGWGDLQILKLDKSWKHIVQT